jgi:hypothetical protein
MVGSKINKLRSLRNITPVSQIVNEAVENYAP